jgi:hypothetical protein
MYFLSALRPDLPGAPLLSPTTALPGVVPQLHLLETGTGDEVKSAKEVPNA